MTIDRRLIAGAMSLALLLAACGGSAATSAPATAAASAAASDNGAASAAPSAVASTDAGSSSGPDISLTPGAAADLERMLPDAVGTLTFTKQSFDGAAVAGAGSAFDSSKVDPVLAKYGKSMADVRLAIATAKPSVASPLDFAVAIAIQIKGVPASQFAADVYATEIAASTKQTIGGKDVYVKTDSGLSTMYYFKDDIAFFISASSENATAILGQLP